MLRKVFVFFASASYSIYSLKYHFLPISQIIYDTSFQENFVHKTGTPFAQKLHKLRLCWNAVCTKITYTMFMLHKHSLFAQTVFMCTKMNINIVFIHFCANGVVAIVLRRV